MVAAASRSRTFSACRGLCRGSEGDVGVQEGLASKVFAALFFSELSAFKRFL